jgi:hypothetical protein
VALSENFIGKVARVRAELEKSSLQFEKKEQLFDILGSAAMSANGSPDKIQSISETLLLSVLLNIEDRVQAEQTLALAIDTAARVHDEGCLFKNSRYGRAVGLVVLIKWPFAVVLCVAMVTNNVDKILDAFARFM